MQKLVAAPLLLMDLHVPPSDFDVRSRAGNPAVLFAHEFLFASGNDPIRIALAARLPVILLGAVLVLLVYAWGLRLHGPAGALAAAALAAFSPNLLAHARLATEDIGCTVFMFAAVWRLWRAVEDDRLSNWAWCGVATGLALAAKFTALLLIPVYGLLYLLLMPGGDAPKGVRWVAVRGAIVACSAVVVIGAAYGRSFDPMLYVNGLTSIYDDVVPGYQYYFMGAFSDTPSPAYTLAAFLVKTPLSFLLLLIGAALAVQRHDHRGDVILFTLIPVGVVIGASVFDAGNFGLRRILPAYPFMCLFAGGLFSRAVPLTLRALGAVLVGGSVVAVAGIHPHYLSYFNFPAGGPAAGPRLLDDSNIDWGQDLPALAAWQRANPKARPLKLAYFGTADPGAYGIDFTGMRESDLAEPAPGYYAISVHGLVDFRRRTVNGEGNFDWLASYEPIARAGWSIYIYRFD